MLLYQYHHHLYQYYLPAKQRGGPKHYRHRLLRRGVWQGACTTLCTTLSINLVLRHTISLAKIKNRHFS